MKKSKIVALTMAGAMAVSIAGAASYKTFTATERPDVKIVMDGQVQNLKDGNGNAVNPLVVNGTTYLPLRATAGLFDKAVNWDGATSTITLGEKVAVERNLFDVGKKTGAWGGYAISGKANLTFDIGEIGVSYDNGIKMTSGSSYYFDFKLNENFEELNVSLLAVQEDSTFRIVDADTDIDILNKKVKKGEILELKGLNIKNVRNLKFRSGSGEIYYLNPIVK